MRPILFLLCLSFALPCTAQRFSVGIRTGASYWPATQHNKEIEKGNSGFSWEKSAYARYSGKRLAYELSVAHNQFNYRYPDRDRLQFDAPSYRELNYQHIINILESRASVQLRATNVTSHIKSYFGASLTYGRQFDHYSFTAQEIPTNALSEHKWSHSSGVVFCGLNNYTSYAITGQLNIHSVVAFDIDPVDALSGFRPSNRFPISRLSWNIGCGYTF